MRNKKLIIIFIILSSICLLLILSGIFFRVSDVEVYCYNIDDRDFEERIINAADLKGASVFIFSENDIINRIHESVSDAKIINIERKFPNRVVINAVKKIRFAYVLAGDRYFVLDNDLKILEETVTEPSDLIELELGGEELSAGLNVGVYLTTLNGQAENVLLEALGSLERFDYRDFDSLALIDSIELALDKDYLYLSTVSGVLIEISGTSNILKKIGGAVALYIDLSDQQRRLGMIRVFESGENINVSYLESESRQ